MYFLSWFADFTEIFILFLFAVRRMIILNTTSVKLNQGSLSFSGSGERLVFLGRISALYLAPGTLSNLAILRTCKLIYLVSNTTWFIVMKVHGVPKKRSFRLLYHVLIFTNLGVLKVDETFPINGYQFKVGNKKLKEVMTVWSLPFLRLSRKSISAYCER